MTYTYNLATPIGQARLHAGDTRIGPSAEDSYTAIFSDEEIQSFLDRAGADPMVAGAYALEAIAADQAKLAQKSTFGDGSQEDLSTLAASLGEQAMNLLAMASRRRRVW